MNRGYCASCGRMATTSHVCPRRGLGDSLRAIQSTLKTAEEQLTAHELDVLYRALLDHVRARRPESVGYLSQLPPPGPIVDPRKP